MSKQMRESVEDVIVWVKLVFLSLGIVSMIFIIFLVSGNAYSAWSSVPRDSIYPFAMGILLGVALTFIYLTGRYGSRE